jgi:hypothetical protein
MDPAKLFVIEALDSQAPEISGGDLLVIDPSWRTKFIGPDPTIPTGNYLVSRQAKLAIRELTNARGGIVKLAAPDGSGRKEVFRVGEEGFTVHGRIIWYGRSLLIAATVRADRAAGTTPRRKIR